MEPIDVLRFSHNRFRGREHRRLPSSWGSLLGLDEMAGPRRGSAGRTGQLHGRDRSANRPGPALPSPSFAAPSIELIEPLDGPLPVPRVAEQHGGGIQAHRRMGQRSPGRVERLAARSRSVTPRRRSPRAREPVRRGHGGYRRSTGSTTFFLLGLRRTAHWQTTRWSLELLDAKFAADYHATTATTPTTRANCQTRRRCNARRRYAMEQRPP